MISQEEFSLLRLIRTDNVGSVTLKKYLDKYGSAENVIKNIDIINSKLKRKISLVSEKEIHQEIKTLHKLGGQFVFQHSEYYPESLKQIHDAPLVLCCLGDVSLLNASQVGMVGSRSVSLLGQKVTRKLASTLSKEGFVITSGLARGVDSLAHQGALDETGKTIAVLGSSVDFVYPTENKKLYDDILEKGGLIISENKTGSGIVSKHQFPKRNRIIAGLSQAVVITECGYKSGSLITGRLALEQGKDLFVIPGHPLDKHFEGSNQLIKQSCAYMVTSADDILQHLEKPKEIKSVKTKKELESMDLFSITQKDLKPETENSHEEKSIKSLLKQPHTIDELVRLTGTDESEIASELTMLELEGSIKRMPGGTFLCK